jgi:hypothetical protein
MGFDEVAPLAFLVLKEVVVWSAPLTPIVKSDTA